MYILRKNNNKFKLIQNMNIFRQTSYDMLSVYLQLFSHNLTIIYTFIKRYIQTKSLGYKILKSWISHG